MLVFIMNIPILLLLQMRRIGKQSKIMEVKVDC